jgi:hypothetical protein
MGIAAQVVEPLQLPDSSVRSVELYEFGMNSFCGKEPVPEAAVRAIPLGSKFKIAAKPLEDVRQGDRALALDGSYPQADVVRLPPDADLREVARWDEGC